MESKEEIGANNNEELHNSNQTKPFRINALIDIYNNHDFTNNKSILRKSIFIGSNTGNTYNNITSSIPLLNIEKNTKLEEIEKYISKHSKYNIPKDLSKLFTSQSYCLTCDLIITITSNGLMENFSYANFNIKKSNDSNNIYSRTFGNDRLLYVNVVKRNYTNEDGYLKQNNKYFVHDTILKCRRCLSTRLKKEEEKITTTTEINRNYLPPKYCNYSCLDCSFVINAPSDSVGQSEKIHLDNDGESLIHCNYCKGIKLIKKGPWRKEEKIDINGNIIADKYTFYCEDKGCKKLNKSKNVYFNRPPNNNSETIQNLLEKGIKFGDKTFMFLGGKLTDSRIKTTLNNFEQSLIYDNEDDNKSKLLFSAWFFCLEKQEEYNNIHESVKSSLGILLLILIIIMTNNNR